LILLSRIFECVGTFIILGSAIAADINLDTHIEKLTEIAKEANSRDQLQLILLLSHNYQLKGMIARDQLDYTKAENYFQQGSLLAQQASSAELNALAIARKAMVSLVQKRTDEAASLYDVAREIARRSSPALRAYLAMGYAEAQGRLGDPGCLASLTEARTMLKRVDPSEDYLLLQHSTRCSEHAVDDCWGLCHVMIGKPKQAIEYYEQLDKKLDLSMTRTRGRLYIQNAEALYPSKDLSCCFYASEGLKLARSIGSQNNIRRVRELASKLARQYPGDARVKDLIQEVQGNWH